MHILAMLMNGTTTTELLKLFVGRLKFDIFKTYDLKDYVQAAKDLEGKKNYW